MNQRISSLTKSSGGSILPSLILRACLPSADPKTSFQQGLEHERHLLTFLAGDPQTKATIYHHLAHKRVEKIRRESPQLLDRAMAIVCKMMEIAESQGDRLVFLGVPSEKIQSACASIGLCLTFATPPNTSPPPALSAESTIPQSFTSDEIISFVFYPIINAALDSLSKEVASSSSPAPSVDGSLLDYLSVDAGLFPRHQGGFLWFAERNIKFQTIVQGLKELSEKFPEGDEGAGRYVACELLESIVESSSSLTEELYFRSQQQQRQGKE
jgi:hypothetical protein